MELSGHTRVIGLIGNPVEHTLSPVIHNGISDAMEMKSVYVPFKVENGGLRDAVNGAYELNILGMNVTVPYKNEVMDYLTDIDDAAKKIGAVNTLVRMDNQHGYKGYNTDMMGLRRQIHEDGISLRNEVVVILGAGGAAKAVTYMCLAEGAKKIYLLNRTLEKAIQITESMKNVQEEFNGDTTDEHKNCIIPMPISDYNQIQEQSFIVFQSTSIGLYPNVDETVIEDLEFYKKVKVGVDLIYNPANTRFMQLVTQSGGKAYNALKMLLYQAVIAYELWHDITISQDVIEDIYVELKRKVYKKDNLVLIGFMGSGKTTFGKAFAKQLGMDFLDADEYIVEQAGKTIPEIFAQDGENAFRVLETEVLKRFRDNLSNTVLATGGGMPLCQENARLLKEIGKVVYLTATPKEIYERVKGDSNRPLLQGNNPYEKICNLMKQRKSVYEKVSDVVVDTNSNDLDEIISDMESAYR